MFSLFQTVLGGHGSRDGARPLVQCEQHTVPTGGGWRHTNAPPSRQQSMRKEMNKQTSNKSHKVGGPVKEVAWRPLPNQEALNDTRMGAAYRASQGAGYGYGHGSDAHKGGRVAGSSYAGIV